MSNTDRERLRSGIVSPVEVPRTEPSPGRAALTDGLAGREVRTSGIVDRTAGSGQALPSDLRGRFEGSLGTSLGDVRIHTDSEASAQAKDLGAKAFTVGQDISFASGRYAPGTPSGDRLIAHEVAHTVQQRGATAGPQLKPEISRRGDALETEADVAATSMVRGERTSIALTPSTNQLISRDEEEEAPPINNAEEMRKAGAAAEKDVTKTKAFVATGTMSTVNDAAAAKTEISNIDRTQDAVVQGEASGSSDWAGASGKNIAAKSALEDFIAQSDVQGTAVFNFRGQYQLVLQDYARLEATAGGFMAANMPNKAMNGDQATNMAKSVGLGGGDRDVMKSQVAEGGPLHAVWSKARETKDALKTKSEQMGAAQTRVIASMQLVAAKQTAASAGIHAITSSDDKEKKALASVKAEIAAVQALWATVADKAKAAASAVAPAGTGAAVGKVLDLVPMAIDAWYAKALAAATIAESNSATLNDLRSVAASQQEAASASTGLKADVMAYNNLATEVGRLRDALDSDMKNMGDKLDKTMVTDNHAYGQLTKLLGDITRFKSQGDATLAIGKQEQTQAAAVAATTDKLVSKDNGKGMPWYSVRSQTELEKEAGVNGGSYGILVWNQLSVGSYKGSITKGTGSAYGTGGANDNIDEAIAQLQGVLGQAGQLEASLNTYFFDMGS